MLMKTLSAVCLMVALMGSLACQNSFGQDEEPKVELKDVKCFLMPKKDAKSENFVEYKNGKVYFCCGGCLKKFNKDPEAFATMANHQLVLTKQYTQKACPISGGEVDADQTSEVGGVKVAFCCEKCKAKVDEAETTEAKAELVFAKEPFEKSFAGPKQEDDGVNVSAATCPMSGGECDATISVEFNSGKVFFCCADCAKEFSADNAAHVAKANQQLVATGQFVQNGCPMSGGKINELQTISVGNAKVGFCCGGCKAKVEKAESDDARVTMLFNKDSFAKAFEKKN